MCMGSSGGSSTNASWGDPEVARGRDKVGKGAGEGTVCLITVWKHFMVEFLSNWVY